MSDRQAILGGIVGTVVLALILLVGRMPDPVPNPLPEDGPDGREESLTTCEKELAGRDFAVASVYEGVPAAPRFDDRDPAQRDAESGATARNYRTVIGGTVAGGPNFAGEYAVATWGFGTGVQGNAVVNVRTGRILAFGLRSFEGVRHRATSSLLILNPVPEVAPPDLAPYRDYVSRFERSYYTVENDALVLLCEENASEGL